MLLVVALWLLVTEALGTGGTEYCPSLLDIPNRLGQKVGGGLFEQISGCAQLGRSLDVGVIIVDGEDENLGTRKGVEDYLGGFQTIQQWHRNVHHDHGWPEFLGQFHRLPTVFRFADDLDVPFGPQQCPKPFADYSMVIRQQDGNSLHLALLSSGSRPYAMG
jgi:hypothetical protein